MAKKKMASRNWLLVFIKFHYCNLSGYSDLSVEEGIVSRRERICVKWILGWKVARWTCGAKVKDDLEELVYGGRWKGKMRELYNIGRREGGRERSRWKVRTWSRREIRPFLLYGINMLSCPWWDSCLFWWADLPSRSRPHFSPWAPSLPFPSTNII